MQSASTGLCAMTACDSVCQNCNPRSCARDNFTLFHNILIRFPTNFLRNCVIIMRFFFFRISKNVEWCEEEDSLLSFIAFMSTRNQSVLKDRLNAERTTSVKNKPLPMVRNSNIPHQLRVNWYSTRVSLNCSKVSQGILGILTILNSCLAASFMNKSKPMLFWETSCSMFCERFQQYWPYRVPMNCGVKLSFILIIMTHHSCNHFGDLYWLNSSIRIIDRNNLPLSLSLSLS